MAKIYVLSMATTSDTFIPYFFHSLEKAQAYMLEMFNEFIRDALKPYEEFKETDTITSYINRYSSYEDVSWILSDNRFQIIGDKERREVYVGHIDTFDEYTFPKFND